MQGQATNRSDASPIGCSSGPVPEFSSVLVDAFRQFRQFRQQNGKEISAGQKPNFSPPLPKTENSLEEALSLSEKQCRFLFDNHPMPMWVYEPQSLQLLGVNEAALKRYGYSREEFLGMGLQDLIGGEPPPSNNSNLTQQWSVRLKDGTSIHVQARSSQIRFDGQLAVLVCASDLHPAEARLSAFSTLGYRLSSARTQREAIQIILDTADSFFGWDACTFDSYSAEQDLMQGVIVIDRLGGVRRELEPSIKNTKPTPRIRQVLMEGPKLILRQEPILMPPDSVPMGDATRPSASLLYVPIRTDERVLGVLSIQSYKLNAYTEADLQLLQALADHGAGALERIQAEEEIKALNADLERRIEERTAHLRDAVGELEAFSYSVSHDMRAPLRAMQGYAQKVSEDYCGKVLDETAREYLARISRAAVRLDRLIQDVLTYTKVFRAEAPMHPVEPKRLIKDLIEAYPEWQPPKAQIQLLGPFPKVHANEALLTQCISNLISNAVKFVAPGVVPQVQIWAESHDSTVRIWFKDNGVGIAPENHWRIFRMFERVYPTCQFEGTGIGLTIVRKAAERMNGKVGFQSEFARGSSFWIELQAA